MTRTLILDVATADGKYHVKQFSDGSSHVLRNGEPWQAYADSAGNLALALARDLQQARSESQKLQRKVTERSLMVRALTT